MYELTQEFPQASYRELEIYRDADRQEEAQRIITQQENEELKEDQTRHGMSTDAQKNVEMAELKDQVKKLKKEIKKLKYANSSK